MKWDGRWVVAAAAAALLATGAPVAAQNVEAGVRAWEAGNYEEAIRNWRPLADSGDQDAQFNLGHAYRVGRGVPQNMTLAEQWYERAARAGHVEAQAMYGLILFQNNRRQEAVPFIQRAAERGDRRAQYVYGTALFNGDVVGRDWPRAYAFMSRAAAQGLPYAQSQLTEMEQHIPAEDRARGAEIAAAMAASTPAAPAPTRVASAAPPASPPSANRPAPTPSPPAPRVAQTNVPPAPANRPPTANPPAPRPVQAQAQAQTQASPPAPRPSAPASMAAASGRWRVQLGAFSNEANARRAWTGVSGRLPGLQPFFVRAGAVVRLQAGPLANRAAADRACAATRQACFPVAP